MGQADAAGLRCAVGAERVEEGQRVLARHIEFGEDRDIGERHAVCNRIHLVRHMLKPVGAAKAFMRHVALPVGEPVGPFRAMGKAHDGSLPEHVIMQRREIDVAARMALLEGIVHAELQAEAFDRLRNAVVAVRPGAEAARIHGKRIHGWCAMHHPVGEELARTAPFHDAHGGAGEEPGILHAMGRADQRIGIGREGDGAVDHRLHARGTKGRNARHGGFDDVFHPLEIGWHEFRAKGGRHAIDGPDLRILLVRPEDEAVAFLAHIPALFRIADDGEFRLPGGDAGGDVRHRVGDEILVQHRNGGHVDAHHPAHFKAPGSGGIHHMPAAQRALGRLDHPVATFSANRLHGIVALDGGAVLHRNLRHGIGGE